jgi:hypothetical protein
VSGLSITDAERAGWQRRAAAELVRILDAHRDLPVIGWTVGRTGATLVGRIDPFAPAAKVRQVWHAWRLALSIEEDPGQTRFGNGATYLRCVAERDGIQLALTATIFNNDEEPTR